MVELVVMPYEGLKNLIAALNRLFDTLLSQDEFAVRGLKVEVDRQMTLDQKTVLATKVIATLEPQNGAEWREFEELITTLRRDGFQVCYPREVEVEVSLPPTPLAE